MGAILDKTLTRAVQSNYFSSSEAELAKQRIIRLGEKYGFNPDDFAILTHTESYGMNPRADKTPSKRNATCTGIIQFCPDFNRRDGIKTIKGVKYHVRDIQQLGIIQQLNLVDDYFSDTLGSTRGNVELVDLYLAVLFPKYVGNRTTGVLTEIPTQAASLYVNEDRTQGITRASIDAGLRKVAANRLGEPITALSTESTANTFGSDFGNINRPNRLGTTSAIFAGKCTEVFPIENTFDEAMRYVGCQQVIASIQTQGGFLSTPSPAFDVVGVSATTLGQPLPSTNLVPGALIWPYYPSNQPAVTPGGKFLNFRTTHYHAGIDIAVPQGTDTLAIADGIVIPLKINPGGYGKTLDLLIPAHGNLVARYAHMSQTIPVGTRVKQGQPIGKSGGAIGSPGAGSSRGPHLHFELRLDQGAGGSFKTREASIKNLLDPEQYLKRLS